MEYLTLTVPQAVFMSVITIAMIILLLWDAFEK